MTPPKKRELPQDLPEPTPSHDGLKTERNAIIGFLVLVLISTIGYIFHVEVDRIAELEKQHTNHEGRIIVIETVLKQNPSLKFPKQ
jgi:hypothetical protein